MKYCKNLVLYEYIYLDTINAWHCGILESFYDIHNKTLSQIKMPTNIC